MEITLNGQLVSCTPKEYKELMDMGFIVNPFSVATQSTQVYPGNIPVLPDGINQLPEATQSTQVYPGNIPVLPDGINQLPETSLRFNGPFRELTRKSSPCSKTDGNQKNSDQKSSSQR